MWQGLCVNAGICHPTEKQGTFHFIVGYFSLKKCALQSYQMTKKESLIMLHMNKSSHFLNLDSSIGTENATKIYLVHMAFHHF